MTEQSKGDYVFFRSHAFSSMEVQDRPEEFQTIKMVTSVKNQKDNISQNKQQPVEIKVDFAATRQFETVGTVQQVANVQSNHHHKQMQDLIQDKVDLAVNRQMETVGTVLKVADFQRSTNVQRNLMTTDKRMQDLIQDNRRMREVIEGLQQENQILARQNQASTNIVSMEASLRAELQAKEMELERLRQQILDMENYKNQQTSAQLQGVRKEVDEWKIKYNKLQAGKFKNFLFQNSKDYNAILSRLEQYQMLDKQLQQLRQELENAHADSDHWKYMLEEQQQDQENQKDQLHNTLNIQIEGLNNEIEGYKNQINQWKIKYDGLLGEIERLKDQMQRMQNKKEIDRLNQINDGYLHEIESWKQRYRTLEQRLSEIQSQNNSNLLLEYQKKFQQMERSLREMKQQLEQKDNNAKKQQAIELAQKTREQTNKINSMEDQLNSLGQENEQLKKLLDQLKQDNTRLSENVSQEDYRAIQLELEYFRNKVIEMEADIEILIQDINSRPRAEDLDVMKREYEARLALVGGDQLNNAGERALVDVWKKRYMECEVQLKEFDNLKQQYAELQIYYEELQAQSKKHQSLKVSLNENETTQLKQQFELEINNYILRIKELEQKIVTLTNDKEKSIKLIQSQFQSQTQTQDQSGIMKIELERLNKLRTDQEQKIQMLIQKITEYESVISVLRDENKFLETRLKERIKSTSGGLSESQQPNKVIVSQENHSNYKDISFNVPNIQNQFFNKPFKSEYVTKIGTTPQFISSAFTTNLNQIQSQKLFKEIFLFNFSRDPIPADIERNFQTSKNIKNQILTSGTKSEINLKIPK